MRIVNYPLAADDPLTGQQSDILAVEELPWHNAACDEAALGSVAVYCPSEYEVSWWQKLGAAHGYSGWRCINGLIQIPVTHLTDPGIVYAKCFGGQTIVRAKWFAPLMFPTPAADWRILYDGVNPAVTFSGVSDSANYDKFLDPFHYLRDGDELTVDVPGSVNDVFEVIMTLWYTV